MTDAQLRAALARLVRGRQLGISESDDPYRSWPRRSERRRPSSSPSTVNSGGGAGCQPLGHSGGRTSRVRAQRTSRTCSGAGRAVGPRNWSAASRRTPIRGIRPERYLSPGTLSSSWPCSSSLRSRPPAAGSTTPTGTTVPASTQASFCSVTGPRASPWASTPTSCAPSISPQAVRPTTRCRPSPRARRPGASHRALASL